MPDTVDPRGPGLLRVLRGIDAHVPQPFLEHRIGQAHVCADAAVEGVVGGGDVVVAPAQLPRVGGENARGEAAVHDALEKRNGKLVVVGQIQLEEADGAIVVSAFHPDGVGHFSPCIVVCCDVFDRAGSGRAQRIGETQLTGYLCHRQLALWVVDLVDADGSESEGRRDLVAEQCGGGVALIDVHQLSRDDSMSEEGLAVGDMGPALAGVGLGVQPAVDGQRLFGAGFELVGPRVEGRHLAFVQRPEGVALFLVPVRCAAVVQLGDLGVGHGIFSLEARGSFCFCDCDPGDMGERESLLEIPYEYM